MPPTRFVDEYSLLYPCAALDARENINMIVSFLNTIIISPATSKLVAYTKLLKTLVSCGGHDQHDHHTDLVRGTIERGCLTRLINLLEFQSIGHCVRRADATKPIYTVKQGIYG
jgi:hypothetical protein